MDALEREERHLEKEYEDGNLSSKDYQKELNELHRDYQASAEESAQRAYDDEMGRW